MRDLHKSLAALRALGGKLESLIAAARGAAAIKPRVSSGTASGLVELTGFGSNPGNLRMLAYAPNRISRNPALVVALHGCGQTAAEYNHGSGWATLAERHGFVVVYPEQIEANNPKCCFSWFLPADIARDQGEARSIHEMTAHAIAKFGIDRRRVYATGLSAGGAMASAMLATYPEVYAGGAIIAGLPYGCARNVQQALEAMFTEKTYSAGALAGHVRRASKHSGRWPKVSVWHGSADQIVKPSNADHIVRQWTELHGLDSTPSYCQPIGRHTRCVWNDASGDPLIEAYSLAGMAHGVPLDASTTGEGCGAAGPFFIDVGLSSTHHIARAWGLTGESAVSRPVETTRTAAPRLDPAITALLPDTASAARAQHPTSTNIAAAFESPGPDNDGTKSAPSLGPARFDPGPIIEAALKAAGLKR